MDKALSVFQANADDLRRLQVDAHFAASLQLFEQGDARIEAARIHIAWGKILHERGKDSAAYEYLQKAGGQFEASGLPRELERVREILGELRIEG